MVSDNSKNVCPLKLSPIKVYRGGDRARVTMKQKTEHNPDSQQNLLYYNKFTF